MRIFETAFEETESTWSEAKEDASSSSRERLRSSYETVAGAAE